MVQRTLSATTLTDLKRPLEGDYYDDVTVTGIGKDGDAIVRLPPNGMVAIVKRKGYQVGERINIKVTRVKDRFVFAEAI